MTVFNSQMFFLGNFSDMDTYEGNTTTENANNILGNHSTTPLVDVEVTDANSNGAVYDDEDPNGNDPSEDFTYNTGAGQTSQLLDSTQTYNAQVMLGDGSVNNVLVTVIQMQNGDVFLTEYANNGTLDNLNVQAITLVSLNSSNYSGFYPNSSVDNSTAVCFTPNALISTNLGPIPVEELRAGNLVRTLDHGFQPIRWVGSRTLDMRNLATRPKLRPVIIRKGALGNLRRMLVSPQHGFLVDGQLVRAKHLADFWGGKVARVNMKCESVTYIHFMCDANEIVFAEGIATESLYPGPMAMQSLDATALKELLVLFPELRDRIADRNQVEACYGKPARIYRKRCDLRREKAALKGGAFPFGSQPAPLVSHMH